MVQHSPSERFIEAMGLMAQTDGTPRIAGQLLAYLIVSGEPKSLSQITEALSISKGSASTNARLLETRGMARRVARVGSRQDQWEASSRPHHQMLLGMADRFRRNAETVERIAADFPPEQAGAKDRVLDFAGFYRGSAAFFEEWHERMHRGTRTDEGR